MRKRPTFCRDMWKIRLREVSVLWDVRFQKFNCAINGKLEHTTFMIGRANSKQKRCNESTSTFSQKKKTNHLANPCPSYPQNLHSSLTYPIPRLHLLKHTKLF